MKVRKRRDQILSAEGTDTQTAGCLSGIELRRGLLPTYSPGPDLLDVWGS